MPIYALADFGSTFTKVAIVEGGTGRLLGAAQHPTTVDSDVALGFEAARDEALAVAAVPRVDRALAASSAAGGLRMVAVGLMDDLTAAAANRCALGAGAKVTAVHSGALTGDEAERVRAGAPDVILFAGGTDGGDERRVLANARVLAAAGSDAAVVVACNRAVADRVAAEFERTGNETVTVANLLPSIHTEAGGPAREAIRELFIDRVVHAKGISETASFFESVLMPTPAAVLACAELLADGAPGRPGASSAVILDVGGATTDVHSVIPVPPDHERIRRAGPMPLASVRTVEGDLGVRWNADSILEIDEGWLLEHLSLGRDVLQDAVAERRRNPSFVPEDALERSVDRALATSCMKIGLERHVGRAATHYFPGEGAELVIEGRDLREATTLLVTGGSLVRDPGGTETAVRTALDRLDHVHPAPRDAEVLVDTSYVVAAAGLLATVDAPAARRLLEHEIPNLDTVSNVE